MRILISGTTGLVGTALIPKLEADGHEVIRLVRDKKLQGARQIHWSPENHQLDARLLEGCEVVIHLGGEGIASGRWTSARKKLLRDSRIKSTRLLAESVAKMNTKPHAFLCASAIGIYGDRDDAILDEHSSGGSDFLATLAQDWEAACLPAAAVGVRVIHLRFGVILSARGGALKKMLPIVRLGLGGVIGSGMQYMSWVSIDDVVHVIEWLLRHDEIDGPVNVVSPKPVMNRDFTRALSDALRRPTMLPVPGYVLRLLFGEMAVSTILASQHVYPAKLISNGYDFQHSELSAALRTLLLASPGERISKP